MSEYSKGLKFQSLNFKAGIHKMLARTVNREDPNQTSYKQNDLGLRCFSGP